MVPDALSDQKKKTHVLMRARAVIAPTLWKERFSIYSTTSCMFKLLLLHIDAVFLTGDETPYYCT